MENINFLISDFPYLQNARKLKSFVQTCVQVFTGKKKTIGKQYSSGHFLHKAVIKREFGIQLFSLL